MFVIFYFSPGRVKRKNAKKGDAGGGDDSGDE